MLRIPRSTRVLIAHRPFDGHPSVDRIVRRAREDFRVDPLTGAIYCYFNRSRTQVHLLVWDHNGFWVMTKRLERGRFELLEPNSEDTRFERERLVMLLSGVDTKSARFRHNFPHEIRIRSRESAERREPPR
jgi:transposase